MRIFTAPCNLTLDDGTVVRFEKGEAVPGGVQRHWYVQAHSENASPVFDPADAEADAAEVAEVAEAAPAGDQVADPAAEAAVVEDAPAGDTAETKSKKK